MILTSLAFQGMPQSNIKLKTKLDSVSYALGVQVGKSMIQSGMDKLENKIFNEALKQVMSGEPQLMEDKEIASIVQKHMQKLKNKESNANLEASKKWLSENKKKKGVVELPSSLQYKVITKGKGPLPSLEDKVEVHYTGTLVNGDVFDSSVERGKPAVFPLKGVIKGWTEALQLMPVGSKWMLYVPPHLGYGEQGGGPGGPNSVLIFEVELLSIVTE